MSGKVTANYQFIKGMVKNMQKREKYEWCQIWWDEADNDTKPRILLIGDSIAVGYRPYVKERIDDRCVDMLATSKAIDDSAYKKELGYMLNEYEYELIHFNNGLHGDHVDRTNYLKGIENALEFIKSIQPASRVIIATSTPVTSEGNKTVINEEMDVLVTDRNNAVKEVARKYKLPIDDLYSQIKGKSSLRVDDGYHYNEDGKKVLGEIVAGCIKSVLQG